MQYVYNIWEQMNAEILYNTARLLQKLLTLMQ
jgi:hypothetical protein